MTQQWLLYSGIGLIALAIVLMMIGIYYNKVAKSQQSIRRQRDEQAVGRVYLLIYKIISKNIFTKHAVHNIRARIEIIGYTNERAIRKKVVQLMLGIMSVLLTLLLTVILVTRQPLLIILFVIVLWFLSETLVEFFVIRLKNRLLAQQIKLNDLIRHKYYETGMVDEAIYQACQSLDRHHHEIGLQGQRIYDVLIAKDIEKEMVTFNDTAPNKFLKMLLGLAYMTMEYGDAEVDGSSVFMRNMGDLTGEIRIELTKREKLNYALKSLNIIVLIPLFCIAPIKNWASGYFVPLKVFYESRTGFLLEIVTVVLIFGCYILLRRLQQFEDNRYQYRKNPLEQRLYDRGLYSVIDVIKPNRKRYYHMKRRLKATASKLTVEAFTTRKLLAFIAGLLFAIGFFLALHYNQRHQVLTSPTLPETFLGGQLSEAEMARAATITASDTAYLSQMNALTSEEAIIKLLEDEGLPIEATKIMAQRLVNKQQILFDQYVKWWEVGMMLLFALVCYQLPVLYLYFQQKVVKIEIEDEVAGFSSIILMLMHHERLSVSDVLEWMELFSTTFKEPIGDCLNNAAAGITLALEGLRDTTDNERFLSIVDSLILASEDITIRQAFDELASDKDFYMEARKEMNQRIVDRKINMGRMVGFAPIYGLILLYMIVPMITSSMADMQQYYNQINL